MRRFLVSAVLTLIWTTPATGQCLEIPAGTAPLIDGVFDKNEWSDATTVGFTANAESIQVRVHLVHDSEQLYLAFEYPGFPDGELVIPEILIDPDNGKTPVWSDDDWWFHVSAQDCEIQGGYDDYDRCGITRPLWAGEPNFAFAPDSAPLAALEIRIPLSMLTIATGEMFGLGLTVHAWPSDSRGYWPQGAAIDQPSTWGIATMATMND